MTPLAEVIRPADDLVSLYAVLHGDEPPDRPVLVTAIALATSMPTDIRWAL